MIVPPNNLYDTHLCALTLERRLRCSGNDGKGALGSGRIIQADRPTAMEPTVLPTGDLVRYDQVVTSSNAACARVSSPTSLAGTLRCWGYTAGDGSYTQKTVPVPVDIGTRYRSLSAGDTVICGTTETEELRCWGKRGFLGIGSPVENDGYTLPENYSPMQVDPGSRYQQVAAGKSHACAVTASSDPTLPERIKCWGSNQSGALANGVIGGSLYSYRTPQLIADGGSHRYRRISSGNNYSCAITTDFRLKCWGYNGNGQLGNGGTTDTAVPVDVDPTEQYAEVFAGEISTCGITLTGLLKCWGSTFAIGRANSAAAPAALPFPVSSTLTFSSASLGGNSLCALSTSGGLYCSGYDEHQQLGNGPGTSPILWQLGTLNPSWSGPLSADPRSLAARMNWRLAIGSDGLLYFWGRPLPESISLSNRNSGALIGDGRPIGRMIWGMGFE
jgi:Regulator of chromosome condensation (RCC1) repeat